MPEPAALSWAQLPALAAALSAPPAPGQWLTEMLARNRHCAYLHQYGSPATLVEFRRQVPVCNRLNSRGERYFSTLWGCSSL